MELELKWLDNFPKQPPKWEVLQQKTGFLARINLAGIRCEIYMNSRGNYGFSLYGLFGQIHVEPNYGNDLEETKEVVGKVVEWVNTGKTGPKPYSAFRTLYVPLHPSTRPTAEIPVAGQWEEPVFDDTPEREEGDTEIADDTPERERRPPIYGNWRADWYDEDVERDDNRYWREDDF